QPRLQELQEDGAGRALGLGGLLEEVVELLLAHVVVDAQLLLLAQAHPVVARLAAPALAVLAGRVGVGLHVALNLRRLDEVHAFAAAELDYRSSVATHVSPSAPYGRLRLRGRQPLCGDGVSSMIVRTFTPVAWIDLIACSRPEPVPRITMSTCEMPMFWAFRVASAAASCAAYGVPFFEPLYPIEPAEDHATVLPSMSVIVTIVLVYEAWMNALPSARLRLTRFFADLVPALAMLHQPHFFGAFFLPATVRRGPLRVRAFVFVD